MRQISPPPSGYRPCVGILLVNRDGGIFVGERLDTPAAWQMPQGGIDDGELPLQAATLELAEETGISSADLVAVSRDWRTYDLPAELSRTAWGGKFRGQAQIWVMFRFTGSDDEIDIATRHPEFGRWKWTDSAGLLAEIVAFKRDIYESVLAEFGAHLAAAHPPADGDA